MKKLVIALAGLFFSTAVVFAQDAEEAVQAGTNQAEASGASNAPWTDTYYQTAEIFKIMENKDAYVVFYDNRISGVGQVVVPKRWYTEKPRKLIFRSLPRKLKPSISVVYEDNAFSYVLITLPLDKPSSLWDILPAGTDLGDALNADSISLN